MTEEQLKAFPAFRNLPIYDEGDAQAVTVAGSHAHECSTIDQVEKCLRDQRLFPLGGLRARPDGQQIVIAYFGEQPARPTVARRANLPQPRPTAWVRGAHTDRRAEGAPYVTSAQTYSTK